MENQKVEHGKFLTRKAFPKFVETFNAMVDFIRNLKGEAEINNDIGEIWIDRTNESHPVIRSKNPKTIDSKVSQQKSLEQIDANYPYSQLWHFDNINCQVGETHIELSGGIDVSTELSVLNRKIDEQSGQPYLSYDTLWLKMPELSGGGSGLTCDLSGLYDFRYDLSSHQLQVKRWVYKHDTMENIIGDWEMCEGGQAYPHSIEVSQ